MAQGRAAELTDVVDSRPMGATCIFELRTLPDGKRRPECCRPHYVFGWRISLRSVVYAFCDPKRGPSVNSPHSTQHAPDSVDVAVKVR